MPLAAISNSSIHTLLLLTRAVSSFIKLYLLLLFLRVLLSWFPTFNWEGQPWLALRQVCFCTLYAWLQYSLQGAPPPFPLPPPHPHPHLPTPNPRAGPGCVRP